MDLFLRCLHFIPVDSEKYYKFTEITLLTFDGVISLQSSSSWQTFPEVRKHHVLNYSSCVFLLLFFIAGMITAPGLLAFLQVSFFLFFFLILHEVGLFCFSNELAAFLALHTVSWQMLSFQKIYFGHLCKQKKSWGLIFTDATKMWHKTLSGYDYLAS